MRTGTLRGYRHWGGLWEIGDIGATTGVDIGDIGVALDWYRVVKVPGRVGVGAHFVGVSTGADLRTLVQLNTAYMHSYARITSPV